MNTSKPTASSLNIIAVVAIALCGLAATSRAQTPAASQPSQPEPVTVFIIGDQTGTELLTKHGIQPLTVNDLDILLNAVLQGSTPLHLLYQEVVEDAANSPVAKLDFRPYEGGQPPKAPSPGLPLSQLAKAMEIYRNDRTNWQKGILDYRAVLVVEIERFIRGVAATQAEVSERFDQMLAKNNGRDVNRSDVLGCVITANKMLGATGRRFLVCNSDAQDEPAKRKPCRSMLTPEQIDPKIQIIFVNRSRLPEQEPMFRGVPNPVHHADSMKEAMEMISGFLGGASGTAAGQSH